MDITQLEKMITNGRDSAMLRLTLARLLVDENRRPEALEHLKVAVELDQGYTAAWKELGRQQLELGQPEAASQAWKTGLAVAEENGDKQAAREMSVFLRRLEKQDS